MLKDLELFCSQLSSEDRMAIFGRGVRCCVNGYLSLLDCIIGGSKISGPRRAFNIDSGYSSLPRPQYRLTISPTCRLARSRHHKRARNASRWRPSRRLRALRRPRPMSKSSLPNPLPPQVQYGVSLTHSENAVLDRRSRTSSQLSLCSTREDDTLHHLHARTRVRP